MPSGTCWDILLLGGPTTESGLSKVLALFTTQIHGATQMSWYLWKLTHTSIHSWSQGSMPGHQSPLDPSETAQEPQILRLGKAEDLTQS